MTMKQQVEMPSPGGASLPENRLPLPRSTIDREPNRSIIIRTLAQGMNDYAAAKYFGIARETVRDFRKRHIERINALAQDAADAITGLWATQKAERVATYSQQAEDCQRLIDELHAQAAEYKVPVNGEEIVRLQKSQSRALRSIAEEIGGLPARVQVRFGGEAGKLVLEGVDVAQI